MSNLTFVLEEFLAAIAPHFGTLIGGVIGFCSGYMMWRLNQRQERIRQRRAVYVRMLQLCWETLDFCRKLAYAKLEGTQAVRQIGTDPMTELLAIAQLQCIEAGPLLHEIATKIQELFALSVDDNSKSTIPAMCDGIGALVNQLNRKLLELASREGLDEGPFKGQILTTEDLKRLGV